LHYLEIVKDPIGLH